MTPADWAALATEFPSAAVAWCRERLDRPGAVELSAIEVAAAIDGCDPGTATALLDRLAEHGVVHAERRQRCPHCDAAPQTGDVAAGVCSTCNSAYTDDGGELAVRTVYVHVGAPGRSVRWVLVLHGMNTKGEWQEQLSWRVATSYRYSVPVYIYKYGMVRPGVLFRRRQRALADQLAGQIRRLAGEHGERLGEAPDVVAHSFGTWLLGHALQRHPDLRVGRVILAGCILRPDFRWDALVADGRVDSVLNHHGSRDFWSRVAEYVIPDSGPSGRVGFVASTGVVNHAAPGFRHNDFFTVARLDNNYACLWQPFLTRPATELAARFGSGPAPKWRPAPLPARATLPRYAVIAAAVLALLLVGSPYVIGLWHLFC